MTHVHVQDLFFNDPASECYFSVRVFYDSGKLDSFRYRVNIDSERGGNSSLVVTSEVPKKGELSALQAQTCEFASGCRFRVHEREPNQHPLFSRISVEAAHFGSEERTLLEFLPVQVERKGYPATLNLELRVNGLRFLLYRAD